MELETYFFHQYRTTNRSFRKTFALVLSVASWIFRATPRSLR